MQFVGSAGAELADKSSGVMGSRRGSRRGSPRGMVPPLPIGRDAFGVGSGMGRDGRHGYGGYGGMGAQEIPDSDCLEQESVRKICHLLAVDPTAARKEADGALPVSKQAMEQVLRRVGFQVSPYDPSWPQLAQ